NQVSTLPGDNNAPHTALPVPRHRRPSPAASQADSKHHASDMPPKELPGFYYDPDKNRYFPTKGRIPGAATRPPRPPPPPAEPSPPPTARRKRARQSELLHAREMYGGGVIFSKNNKSTFKQQCQYTQASQPMVWKYQGTTLVADKALEELHAMVQTPSGLRESKLLATGSTNGSIRLFGLGTALENFEDGMEFLPQPVWTPLGKQIAAVNSPLANIWSSETAFSNFSSSISCIKKFGRNFHDAASTNSSVQQAWWLLLDLEDLVVLFILWICQLLTLQRFHGMPMKELKELLHLIVQYGLLIVILMAHK
uniref:Transducin/WD40 repeat-like superfamily protein n=4 Tax=Aegilops tauschii subsp. strangulata TaxID=200361 RepID=A0A453BQ21_AEGTS